MDISVQFLTGRFGIWKYQAGTHLPYDLLEQPWFVVHSDGELSLISLIVDSPEKLDPGAADAECAIGNPDFRMPRNTSPRNSGLRNTSLTTPSAVAAHGPWSCFRIIGQLDFGLVGIAARVSAVLAAADISLLVQSSFDTDFFFVASGNAIKARHALEAEGIQVRE